MRDVLRFKISVVVLSMLLCQFAVGQAVYGNIVGTVNDPSGAAVPNAQVKISDLDRGVSYRTTANTSGNYEQTHLLAGRYKVDVTAAGFSPFETTAIVQIDSSTRVDARLGVQGESTQVTVTAETPLLKVDRADVSTTLTTNELEELPILNRNLTQTLLITPGTQINDWNHAAAENPQAGYQIDVNGQQFTANGFLLDGTENESAILGIAVINPNIDSLEEFKVTTSDYDAQFGSVAGALLQATTKSGSNSFHGSAFEFVRNDKFNANDRFSGLNLPLRWNQFGGSVGGPIKKDKLFFFGDYQATRRRRAASTIATVPTASERAGDLRGLLGNFICSDGSTSATPCASPWMVPTTEGGLIPAQGGMIFDPSSGDSSGANRAAITTNGQPNVIPVPAAVTNILKFLPMPNTNAGAIFNNYIGSGSEHYDSDQVDGRIDYNYSEKMHLFGRYTIADFTLSAPGAYGSEAGGPSLNGIFFAGSSLDRNQSLALGTTYTFNPSLISDFRFGIYRYRIRVQPNGVGSAPAADAGFPGLNLGSVETSGMPAFYVNGNGGFNFGYALGINQCNCPLKETENHFQWVNNWTKTKGNHTIAWGADIRRAQQQRIPSDSHRSGEINFFDSVTGSSDIDAATGGSVTTGSGLAAFLLAEPGTFARYFTGIGFHPGLRQTRLFFYGQDAWRVTHKLTLNYGLRYENYLPQTAASPGGAGSFDPNTGEVLVAGVGSVPLNMGVKPYNLGFAPRLGIAYQATQRTVVRAGYGRSFTPAGLGAVFGQAPDYDPPITNPQSINSPNGYTPVFSLLSGPPVPTNPPIGSNGRYPLPDGLSVSYFFNPPSSYRIPLADSWNLSIQHEFTPTLTAEIGYVGNVGRHLFVNPNVNQAALDPNCMADGTCSDWNLRRHFFQLFGLTQPIYQTCNCDNSSYNAMQIKVQKRASRGLDFLLTYTYGKAMANTETGSAFANNLDWWQDHGPANYDRTHTLTVSYVWELPFGRSRHWGGETSGVVAALLGGWDLSGITTVESGLPFTPNVSNAPLVFADLNQDRPDLIGNPSVPNPSANLWFNPAAFTAPQGIGRNGDVRHNSFRGPGLYNFDVSLGKVFTVAEGKTLEFKWETYNATNHVNLANPNPTVDVSGAGQITAATAMRQMQFGLHFRF
ncbi:MAG: TonB-dependent receptor [Acidobacteria bacterium]|nr:TonB-dependent receptor [Acidobacteriota bacterium]